MVPKVVLGEPKVVESVPRISTPIFLGTRAALKEHEILPKVILGEPKLVKLVQSELVAKEDSEAFELDPGV